MQNNLPKIAVCMAAFNGQAWLKIQIDSILAQNAVEVTLFISVDASSDGTESFVDRLSAQHHNIAALPHGQHFGGAGANFFRLLKEVDFAAFDFIAFADQDDIWLPNKLSRACAIIAASGADAYSSDVTAFWPDGRQQHIKKSQPQVKWDFLFEAAGPGCTYVIGRTLADNLKKVIIAHPQAMQKIALHDWFCYAYARANGFHWVIDNVPGMLYRQHAQNQVGANAGLAAFIYRAKKVLNGWSLKQSALIANTVGLANDPFVRAWSSGSRRGYLQLAFSAWQCRRRLRDKLLFCAACLTLSMLGTHQQLK